MINRFDKPAESNFVNTYVPLPIDQLMQVAQQKQQAWDQSAIAELELGDQKYKSLEYLQDPSTGQMIRNQQHESVKKFVQDFNSKLDNISATIGTTDKGSPLYRLQLAKLQKQWQEATQESGILGKSAANATRYEQMQKQWRENPYLASNRWMANDQGAYLRQFANSQEVQDLDTGVGLKQYTDVDKELLSQLSHMPASTRTYDRVIKDANGKSTGMTEKVWQKGRFGSDIEKAALALMDQGQVGDRLAAEYDNMIMQGVSKEKAAGIIMNRRKEIAKNMARMLEYEDIGSDIMGLTGGRSGSGKYNAYGEYEPYQLTSVEANRQLPEELKNVGQSNASWVWQNIMYEMNGAKGEKPPTRRADMNSPEAKRLSQRLEQIVPGYSTYSDAEKQEYLTKYAKEGDKILDTHGGSFSIAIACHDYGFELTACELDEDYYNSAVKRITNHVGQQKLF